MGLDQIRRRRDDKSLDVVFGGHGVWSSPLDDTCLLQRLFGHFSHMLISSSGKEPCPTGHYRNGHLSYGLARSLLHVPFPRRDSVERTGCSSSATESCHQYSHVERKGHSNNSLQGSQPRSPIMWWLCGLLPSVQPPWSMRSWVPKFLQSDHRLPLLACSWCLLDCLCDLEGQIIAMDSRYSTGAISRVNIFLHVHHPRAPLTYLRILYRTMVLEFDRKREICAVSARILAGHGRQFPCACMACRLVLETH